jgi:hypothetical protein
VPGVCGGEFTTPAKASVFKVSIVVTVKCYTNAVASQNRVACHLDHRRNRAAVAAGIRVDRPPSHPSEQSSVDIAYKLYGCSPPQQTSYDMKHKWDLGSTRVNEYHWKNAMVAYHKRPHLSMTL